MSPQGRSLKETSGKPGEPSAPLCCGLYESEPSALVVRAVAAARDCLSHLGPPVLTSPQEQAFCKTRPPCPLSAGIPEAESSVEKPDLVVVLEVLALSAVDIAFLNRLFISLTADFVCFRCQIGYLLTASGNSLPAVLGWVPG